MSKIMTNQQLVDLLMANRILNQPRVVAALLNIRREYFVPSPLLKEAYADYPLPIGFGQTISQPSTVVFMLEQLEVWEGQKVLEIGSGCGWVSALLAYLVEPKGQVIGLDIIPELVELARANTERFDFKNLEFIAGDGNYGYVEASPYDRIIVSAGASELPPALAKQLTDGGRIVIPVGSPLQEMVVIEKDGEKLSEKKYPGFVFVPLVNKILR